MNESESIVGWLESTPHHWTVGPLKRMLAGLNGGVSPQAEGGLSEGDEPGVLKSGCVNGGWFNDEEHKRLPTDFQVPAGIQVRIGDVLVCRASGSIDLVGSCAIVKRLRYNLILSDKTFRLKPARNTVPEFLAWLLNSAPYRTQVAMAVSGAEGLANNLPSSSLKNFIVAIPPSNKQSAIADFLDRETAQIDVLIGKQNALIELLAERRKAVITRAVTKGLDPQAPTKPSGHAWMGDIPAHWDVVQSRRIFSLRDRRAGPRDVQLTASQKYGVIPQAEYMSLTGSDLLTFPWVTFGRAGRV